MESTYERGAGLIFVRESTMHVISWNVNGGHMGKCLDGIRDLDPDILLLQEVSVSAENAYKSHLQSKGLPYWSPGGYGNFIASKWQISEPFCKWPKPMPSFPSGFHQFPGTEFL